MTGWRCYDGWGELIDGGKVGGCYGITAGKCNHYDIRQLRGCWTSRRRPGGGQEVEEAAESHAWQAAESHAWQAPPAPHSRFPPRGGATLDGILWQKKVPGVGGTITAT